MIEVSWFIIETIFWFSLFGFIVGLSVYGIFACIYHDMTKEEQKITYKELIHLMPISSEKWRFNGGGAYAYAVYTDGSDRTDIYMKSYFDCLRFQHLINKSKKESSEDALLKEKAKLVRAWQRDINNYQERYMNELKKMRDRIK